MTNFHSVNFDWQLLKEHIQTFENLKNGDNVPVTEEWEKYVRLQKFLREHSHISAWSNCRDKTIEMAIEFHLSPYKAALLYLNLQNISSRFSFGRSLESLGRAASAFKPLEDIEFSLTRLSTFSEKIIADHPTPQMRIVEKKLENAAHFWAENKLAEVPKNHDDSKLSEIWSYGFDHRVDGFYHSYDSLVVVRQWLRTNVLMAKLIKAILSKPQTQEDKTEFELSSSNRGWIDELSEIERLVGHILPELYERISGRKFKLRQNKIQQAVAVDETKFVSYALVAMQLTELDPETIASHRKAVLKVKPTQK